MKDSDSFGLHNAHVADILYSVIGTGTIVDGKRNFANILRGRNLANGSGRTVFANLIFTATGIFWATFAGNGYLPRHEHMIQWLLDDETLENKTFEGRHRYFSEELAGAGFHITENDGYLTCVFDHPANIEQLNNPPNSQDPTVIDFMLLNRFTHSGSQFKIGLNRI